MITKDLMEAGFCFRCGERKACGGVEYPCHYVMRWHGRTRMSIALQSISLCMPCRDEVFDKITKALHEDKA